jgi:hypothetical protein
MNASLRPRRLVQVAVLLAALGAGASAAAATPPAPAKSRPLLTHVIFMGADLAAERNRVFHPVVDVTDNSLVIEPGGQPVRLPLAQTSNLRITEALKLADTSVGLDDFKAEPAYSAGADPTAQLAKIAALAAGQMAEVDLAASAERSSALAVAGASAAVASASNPEDLADSRAALARAQGRQAAAGEALDRALSTPNSPVYDVGAQAARIAGREMFDAIRVSFVVTAESDLLQPYYAVIALIRDPDDRQPRKWVYVRPLGAMGAGETQRVTVHQSGFAPGYSLEACEVHVYDGDRELATPLSRRRVAISDDEALAYRVIEYTAANKGRTLPASLATRALTTEAWASVSREQLAATHHVRVAKDGRVTGTYADAAGRKPLTDGALVAVLTALHFHPALESGKPVESIVPVVLGNLPIR